MNNYIEQIRERLPKEELLAQLAEEGGELVQAALKLRRVYDGANPTPVSCAEAVDNLHEEIADVWTVLLVLGIEPHYNSGIYDIMNQKTARWAHRLAERAGEAMNETPELKPCPFCGGEAELRKNYNGMCGVYIDFSVMCGCGATHGKFEKSKEAIEAWNRRVSDDLPV